MYIKTYFKYLINLLPVFRALSSVGSEVVDNASLNDEVVTCICILKVTNFMAYFMRNSPLIKRGV